MGLFSSKTKHYVDTQVQRVVEDDMVPDAMTNALIRSLFTEQTLTGAILDSALNGGFRNFERMYRYAEKGRNNGGYWFGLPDARQITTSDGFELAEKQIEAEVGRNVTLDYLHFRPLNNIHAGWEWITRVWQYNHETNELVKQSNNVGYPVYLDKMVAVHRGVAEQEPELSALGNWDNDPANGYTQDRLSAGLEVDLSTGIQPLEQLDSLAHEMRIGPNELESVEIHWTGEEILYETTQALDGNGQPYKVKLNTDGSVFLAKTDSSGEYILDSQGDYIKAVQDEGVQGTFIYNAANEVIGYNVDDQNSTGSKPVLDPNGGYMTITTETGRVTHSGTQTVDLSMYDGDQEYYQAKYHYGDTYGYWIYDPTTGSNVALNEVYDLPAYSPPGTYFPFAIFRQEDRNNAEEQYHDTDKYKSTVKMLDILGMDYQEMSDSLHESDGIKDVDQAVMMMAVPITTEDEGEIDYLWRYFKALDESMPTETDRTWSTNYTHNVTPDRSYAIDISDADFRVTLSFDNITRQIRPETIGDGSIGNVSNTIETETQTLARMGWLNLGLSATQVRVFRKQVAYGIVEEILVRNPKLRYHIYKKKGAEGGIDDDRMLIPLDFNICRQIPLMKRESLYFRSLHFIFNSHVKQKEKWYEKGIFKVLLVVVAVVITVISYGATWQSLVAAAGGIVTSAVVLAMLQVILMDILIGFAIQLALTEIVSQIGPEWGLYLAVAAAAVGGYKAIKAGGIVASTSAQKLLMVSTGLAKGVGEELKHLFSEYQQDVAEFNLLQEEKWEELQEIKDALDVSTFLDPNNFIREEPLMVWGESPDAYYNRTVHSSNPGVASIKIVQNFVDFSLRLPTTQDTLGELFYE